MIGFSRDLCVCRVWSVTGVHLYGGRLLGERSWSVG